MKGKRAVGEAIAALPEKVVAEMLDIVRQAKDAEANGHTALIAPLVKRALDTPHRSHAKLSHWMASMKEGRRVANECVGTCGLGLEAVESELEDLKSRALAIQQAAVSAGLGWTDIAEAIEQEFGEVVEFDFDALPLPGGYTSIWGEGY